MTWIQEKNGYQLFFNRDELRTRQLARPPEVQRSGLLEFIAPSDGDHGGTWIAVNETGLGLCLLNGFPAPGIKTADSHRDYSSRGCIALGAIGSVSVDQVVDTVHELKLDDFRPFILVAIQADGTALQVRWSGRVMDVLPAPPQDRPLVSSSFCTESVRASRETVHDRMINDPGPGQATQRHLAFHSSHRPAAGPYSTCMHRDDASTVSFSRIEVCASEILFHYVPHSPCRGLPQGPIARLQRRQGS